MDFFGEDKDLVLPVVVVIVSAAFGLFSYMVRPAPIFAPVAVAPPEPSIGASEPDVPPVPSEVQHNASEAAQDAAQQPQPEPYVQEQFIVSNERSTLYVVQETPLYSCPDRSCDIVNTLFPGIYWNLPFTLSPDGWFETGIPGDETRGYVAVSNLSKTVPGRCTLVLPYRVGYVGSDFLAEGFTHEQLVSFVRAAEKQVEEVVGRNILSYEDDAPNTVNFVISHYRDNEPYHRGLHTSDAVFPNGTVGQFWIGIYAALFSDVNDWLDNHYIGPEHVAAFKQNYMKKALLHEMVHTTGMLHVNDPTAVMCGAPDCRPAAVDFSSEQLLTAADKAALRDWCSGT